GGYTGDNGPAVSAALFNPEGVAVDAQGDLFIADTFNNVVREVNAATHLITTVSGNGTQGYGGDNGPPVSAEMDRPDGVAIDSQGDLFIADTGNAVIREVEGGASFHLNNNGKLTEVSNGKTTLIDSGVGSFSQTGANLLELRDDGQLYLDGASGFKLLDIGVAVYQSDAAGNVYILESDGTLREYPAGGPLSLTPLASNVQSMSVTA